MTHCRLAVDRRSLQLRQEVIRTLLLHMPAASLCL
jgi:hypothetical protein